VGVNTFEMLLVSISGFIPNVDDYIREDNFRAILFRTKFNININDKYEEKNNNKRIDISILYPCT